MQPVEKPLPKPDWLKVKLPTGAAYQKVKEIIDTHDLHTVCESAACPNRGECWSSSTATFMILGNVCTRSCGFCNVITGKPTELDLEEPWRVADAVQRMGLKYAVITSVNRDELKDGGANVWAKTIQEVRRSTEGKCQVEVLIPDFMGNWDNLDIVLAEKPDVLNHNIETVPRLYLPVRPQGNYKRSLELLLRAKEAGMTTKSGLMVGLGESLEEVFAVLDDLQKSRVDIVTIGQYMQPTPNHLPVARYVHPDEFKSFEDYGRDKFAAVFSGPLVRSSYHAGEVLERTIRQA
ncbi:MAG: lipoyl synthase [Candidatus Obscuribacterales bacterium]|nr:lipoyl synthase [Candidatus Obscuribacterales bacterium]